MKISKSSFETRIRIYAKHSVQSQYVNNNKYAANSLVEMINTKDMNRFFCV